MRAGCLVLEVEGLDTWVLLWPGHYSVAQVGERISVSEEGVVLASVGDEVAVAGGERSDEDATRWAVDVTEGTLPLSCWTAPYWLVTSVR